MSRNISGTLMVPIHLDALLVGSDGLEVVREMADYSQLPHRLGKHWHNRDNAYLSETILAQPLSDRNLQLKPGVHLHWALPDALTHGLHDSHGTTFPRVPNRWAILRRGGGQSDQSWIVESDYIYAVDDHHLDHDTRKRKYDSAMIHYPSDHHVPFRYLGNRWSLNDWLETSPDSANYLSSLTAIGPQETVAIMDDVKATFAAFYPNCRTVFGFHDDTISGDHIPNGLNYYVIGWYSDGAQDCIAHFIQNQSNLSNAELLSTLQTQFNWDIADGAASAFPQNSLHYAKLNFTGSGSPSSPNESLPTPELAIGNTGTEALSAYLADQINGKNGEGDQTIKLEEQLEAIQILPKLEGQVLDHMAAFKEARHTKGFAPHSAGLMWTIQLVQQESSENALSASQMTLPDELAQALNQLNLDQQTYDRALTEMEDKRLNLFVGWYKYMVTLYHERSQFDYPDANDTYYYLDDQANSKNNGQIPVNINIPKQVNQVGQLRLPALQADGSINGASATGDANGAAQSVASGINSLITSLEQHNQSAQMQQAHRRYVLKPLPAPRYWQATEPSLLLTGEAVQPSNRHSSDGRLTPQGWLTCQLASYYNPTTWHDHDNSSLSQTLATLKNSIDQFGNQPGEKIGFTTWTDQPWHPFMLEWEANISGLKPGNGADYTSDFISKHYTLPENAPDLSGQSQDFRAESSSYLGYSLLTPHANLHLQDKIVIYLNQYLLPSYYKANEIQPSTEPATYLQAHIGAIKAWYENHKLSGQKSADPIYTALQAYQRLQGLSCLSQALGGFNDALIMLKRTMQLEVADSHTRQNNFPQEMARTIGQTLTRAPHPNAAFTPIRSGLLQLGGLRLVDTFGQVKSIVDRTDPSQTSFIVAETMRDGSSHNHVNLPPRLAQPARLNFRWLSANHDQQEMNAHPAHSPICGWLLPNNLDSSLMIYNAQGQALGSINSSGSWALAPGSSAATSASQISNTHLRQMVQYLLNQGHTFQQAFLSAVDNALETIDPANFAQHQGLALLMGRPIALVRAAVSMELQGLPAVDRSWAAFTENVKLYNNNDKPLITHDHNFTQVQVPVRLGEYQQLNDGLVGYWLENGAGGSYQSNTFYAPQSDSVNHRNIKTHADGPVNLLPALDGRAQYVSMLVDPRGGVHATCGILPSKTISIPRDQYSDALSKIDITFLTTPLLTDNDQLNLSLPEEPGYEWSWLTQNGSGWHESTAFAPLNPTAVFAKPQVIREGWLKLKQKN